MTFSKQELEETLRHMESEVDELTQKVENLTGQLELLGYGLKDLEQQEERLLSDLDNATWPNNLNRKRQPAEIAIDIAKVCAGISELGSIIREKNTAHKNLSFTLKGRLESMENFKEEFNL